MQYSKVAILSAVAGSAVASYNSTVTDIATTVVTITSCEENKCTEVPVTTGLTTVTEVDTIYTTYCPLPSTEAPESSAPETKAPETSAPASKAPESSSAESKSTVAAESSEAPSVSSFEAGAGKLQVGAALVGAAALLL